MNTFGWARRSVVAAATATLVLGGAVQAEEMVEQLHFIVPGGAGGGWDGTARGTGEALTNGGLVGNASYENMSGGGGGVAIAYMIENADSLDNTLMVNSTPIVIRSLTGVFPQSFRDLTLVAGTIGDYAALVVPVDSPIENMEDLLAAYAEQGPDFAVGGGSVPGGMDHLVAAMVMQAAGEEPTALNYIPYDAGGEAMAGLLSGEIDALSTGFSEAIALAEQDEVRIVGVTAPERVPAYDEAPTFTEQGIETTFINWRGFFGPPGLDEATRQTYVDMFAAMYETDAWEEVRARNGWVNIFNPGEDFRAFLEQQEQEIGDLMRVLGFL
ncbi:tripartite tricarboxylate transporter substrate binding protein [Jannaschia seohaensis]|uniref:Putative tricarboxylic transport membrane protein n=1 Tax=Jannaschia seohaensis TaxID=475081 RepID=A0A2Y9C2X2_9RHOB|nr:tripartite tricarboxylate transporter substrate-binding protein [Jannaschia seohaensis]PWJ21606.1 putative tricarboxylic transport membrane protein [Jannaschia seohaensis]SSA36823.1 putative tricarboxylic transport membrane protein [Jannaschia seohaensis]